MVEQATIATVVTASKLLVRRAYCHCSSLLARRASRNLAVSHANKCGTSENAKLRFHFPFSLERLI